MHSMAFLLKTKNLDAIHSAKRNKPQKNPHYHYFRIVFFKDDFVVKQVG